MMFSLVDWLEAHSIYFDCYNNTFDCIGEHGKSRTIGIPKVISIRNISSLQLNKFFREGCLWYTTYVLEPLEYKGTNPKAYPLLQELKYVFPMMYQYYSPKEILIFQLTLLLELHEH
jgi:hypothetical protein